MELIICILNFELFLYEFHRIYLHTNPILIIYSIFYNRSNNIVDFRKEKINQYINRTKIHSYKNNRNQDTLSIWRYLNNTLSCMMERIDFEIDFYLDKNPFYRNCNDRFLILYIEDNLNRIFNILLFY